MFENIIPVKAPHERRGTNMPPMAPEPAESPVKIIFAARIRTSIESGTLCSARASIRWSPPLAARGKKRQTGTEIRYGINGENWGGIFNFPYIF